MASKLTDLVNINGLAEFLAQMQTWVNDQIPLPAVYDVSAETIGTVTSVTSVDPRLNYATVKSMLDDYRRLVALRVDYEGQTVYVTANQEYSTQNGPIVFFGIYTGTDDQLRLFYFRLSSSDTLSADIYFIERWTYKVQDVAANSTNTLTYPSTKAVFSEFQRKPVTIWRAASASDMLKGIQADLTADPAWQLTGLDLTPYKRIKVYSKCGRTTGVTASNSTTAAMVLEMSLDPGAAIAEVSGHYCGSIMSQKPNDANRLATLTCAVSSDKTKFAVLRQTNLYGTAATSNNDVGANVFLIEGYYD